MSNLGEQAMEILDELHTERLAYESEYVPLADAANLLTAYEETGLAPEDILSATDMAKVACALHELNKYKELGDLDRLRELVEADREGRCVVLPCKVGDKVKIDANTWGNVWNYKTIEHGKFLVGEIISIIKTKKQTLIKIKAEHNVEWKRPTKRYPVSAIGLTVFVKSKSAVAALKGEKDGE